MVGRSLRIGFPLSLTALLVGRTAVRDARVVGTYKLVVVGTQPPEYWSHHGACDVPFFSVYTFTATRWNSVDTLLSTGECHVCETDSVIARRDSGYYRVRHDTLNLWVDDTVIGVKGWVDHALIRGDTLRFPAGEFDPGDYVYVRRRP
jgi:hypothetical protein